jgi:hypothetical protein
LALRDDFSTKVAANFRFTTPRALRAIQNNVAYWQILLQKSAAVDYAVVPFRWGGGIDALAPTLFTQFQRYAMHRTCAGGGRATARASRRRF